MTLLEHDASSDGVRRVLLKLSGETFGAGSVGVDAAVLQRVAGEIAEAAASGIEVAIVVGGGNFFRGAELQQSGMDRARADYMGTVSYTHLTLPTSDLV